MNNSCPSCGAIYNVAAKDVGRRIKCKKCGTALIVTEAGLEVDAGGPPPAPAPMPAGPDDAYDDEEIVSPSPRSRTAARRSAGGGFDVMKAFHDFGGVWSILFGVGAFLVIVFLFQPIIGQAKVASRDADIKAAQQDWAKRQKQLEKDNRTSDIPKEQEKFDKRMEELQDRVESARVSNRQSVYWERYFMMFGFVFLMVGSLGYLMPGQPLVRRVVGAVVLCAEMVLVFLYFIIRSGISDVSTGA